jgi:hypothetical protein
MLREKKMTQEITRPKKNGLNPTRLTGICALLAGGCLLASLLVILAFIPCLTGDTESKFACITSNPISASVVYTLWIIESLAYIPVIVGLASISAVHRPSFKFWQMLCGFAAVFFMLCSYLAHSIFLIQGARGSIPESTFNHLTNLAYNLEPIGFPLLCVVNILFGVAVYRLKVRSYRIILWLTVGILALAAFGGILMGAGFLEIGKILVAYGTWFAAGIIYIFIGIVFVRTKQVVTRETF